MSVIKKFSINSIMVKISIVSALLLSACVSTPYKELSRTNLDKISLIKINTEQWHIKVGTGIQDTYLNLIPAVHSGVVYANSTDGTVLAISSQSGKQLWSKQLRKHLGLSAQINTDTNKERMDLNRDAGEKLFKALGKKSLGSSLGVDDDRIFVADTLGLVYALDKVDGTILWQSKMLGEIDSTPVSDNKIVLIRTTDGATTALNVDSGAVVWQHQHRVSPFSLQGSGTPIFLENQILAGTSGGDILSLNKQSGDIVWIEPITFAHGKTVMDRIVDADVRPMVLDNYVFVASMHGNLVKLDKLTGNSIWSTTYSTAQPLSLNKQTLIASHEDGFFGGFSQKTGVKVWQNNQLLGYDLIGPIVFDNNIVVATRGSNLLFWLNSETYEINAHSKIRGDKIINLSKTDNGILVYTKNGTLSLHQR